ncbi:hypothetical protein Ae201684_009871 [Aphanomyces euteiches]|uniref:Uncharacterized protein n=1 Tax=Aphanomyces euteiches TaxID=100861 RepID=A0A6G0WZQ0_9STRA|nr:hypothetical protein Ae201684_009871 [Aphanomyces euteiches]
MENSRVEHDAHPYEEGTKEAIWASFKLRCNACWEVLCGPNGPQTCYRTACSHIFCEKDAYKHFGEGDLICPACQEDLNQRPGGVCEMTVKSATDPRV